MRKAKGVSTRNGTRMYQWAIKTPKDLLIDGAKPWACRVSLGTEDLATANRKAAQLEHEWLERFERQRKQRTPTTIHKVTPAVLQLIKSSASHGLLNFDQQLRWDDEYLRHVCIALNVMDEARESPGIAPDAIQLPAHLDIEPAQIASEHLRRGFIEYRKDLMLKRLRVLMQEMRDRSGKAYTHGDRQAAVEIANTRAKECGLQIDWLAPENSAYLPEILEAELQAIDAVLARHDGAVIPTPAKPQPPVEMESTPASTTHTIFDALAEWKLNEVKRPAKTVSQFTYAAKLFDSLMVGRSLESLTTACGVALTNGLKRWADSEGRSQTTAHNRHLEIRALLKVATRKGWCAVDPMQGTSIKKQKTEREPWTPDDLKRLFCAPLFDSYALPKTSKAGLDAAYWIPLLGLFTGARISELCQLRTDDVSEGTEGLVIEIRESTEHGQRLKNDNSHRAIPVHSELIRLGFRDYWKAIAEAGATPGPLFPVLPQSGMNGAGGQFGKWFGEFKKAQGFDTSRTFHSFRHTLETELGFAGVGQTLVDAITGHAGQGIGRTTYGTTLRRHADRLRPALERLTFPDLKLQRVFVAPAWTKPTA
ncbi:site-specific integrase [Roseateles sp.]|uniref:site-specific integrase n=1 Tax=Roseateles sp. TaxID=1971397 RepID=UPI003D1007FD